MDRILEQNDTLFKLFEYSAARWHGRPMASYIDGSQAYTYGSFQEKVLKMSVLLARHHVYGGKVAILAENCPNWTVAFFASAAMGRVAVPILPASSQMEVSNILDHSESEALFVSARQLRKVEEGLRKKMKLIVDIDTLGVISTQNDGETEQNRKVAVRNAAPQSNDLAAMDACGRFYIRGRLNNVILGATGENIYPEEIEFVINSYPGVGESLVVERGRDLVGLVHMEEGAEHGSLADAAKSILEYVNKRVNKQSALARIEMLAEPFKKTATQKIRRFLYMSPSHA